MPIPCPSTLSLGHCACINIVFCSACTKLTSARNRLNSRSSRSILIHNGGTVSWPIFELAIGFIFLAAPAATSEPSAATNILLTKTKRPSDTPPGRLCLPQCSPPIPSGRPPATRRRRWCPPTHYRTITAPAVHRRPGNTPRPSPADCDPSYSAAATAQHRKNGVHGDNWLRLLRRSIGLSLRLANHVAADVHGVR
jgi:hypothetical protein